MIYVMSDIHGNSKKFNSVMEQIQLKDSDTLYVLGDVIDRYGDGIKILRKLMTMPNVKMLMGNHEYAMLHALGTNGELTPVDEKQYRIWMRNGGDVTVEYLKHIRKSVRKEVFEFVEKLPTSYEVYINDQRYVLVHGAPEQLYDKNNPRHAKYKDAQYFSIWYRLMYYDVIRDDYTVVFGHTPTSHYQLKHPLCIYKDTKRIGIDCGSGFPEDGSSFIHSEGRLACLRLDDMKTFYSK